MNVTRSYSRLHILSCCVLLAALALAARAADSPRQRQLLDSGWKFQLGDPSGASAPEFSDTAWRTVDLPHDWSIEGKIDPKAPMGGGGGFFPAGVGWYRHAFDAPETWQGKRVSVEFEGVYMNAEVWLNGRRLGAHPYGYTAFFFDLTPQLKPGAKNVLAVRVDNSRQKNSRWYSGSGIYRHVWLHVTQPLHIAPWGVAVTTPEVSTNSAKVVITTKLLAEGSQKRDLKLQTTLLGPDGAEAARIESDASLEPGASQDVTQTIALANPALWSPETPKLYRAVTTVLVGKRIVDAVETPFGIRSLQWSAERGLQLNGQTIKLCGGCVHHDNGCLGAAAFDRAETRRVELLKAAGFNAIRTSHNPPSSAFLGACDRLGVLVMDEAFDCWEKGKNPHDYSEAFKDWWRKDIDAMVLRDRNHPSIFAWSVGNETPQRADALELTKQLVAQVKKNDPTRPVTEAICDFWDFKGRKWPETDAAYALLDIGGYNYMLHKEAEDHQRAPGRIMACTESYPRATFEMWSLAQQRPYIIGDFVWTALDYLGEAGIGRVNIAGEGNNDHGKDTIFPIHGGSCGDLDINLFRKPLSHYRNIVWDRGEKLYVAVINPPPVGKQFKPTPWGVMPAQSSWTWPGQEGKPLQVEVYSSCDKVRLYLNDKLIGEKPATRAEQFKAVFAVPYAPGTLKAVALKGESPVETFTLQTAGDAAQIKLTPDHTKLSADGQDLAFVTVEITDKDGRPRPDAANELQFALSGPGAILGVSSADLSTAEPYQSTTHSVYQGRALVVVRTSRQPGELKLTATAPNLQPATATLTTQQP